MEILHQDQQVFSSIDQHYLRGKPFLFAINFDATLGIIQNLQNADPSIILYDFNGTSNSTRNTKRILPPDLNARPESFPVYLKRFKRVQEQIKKGNTYLLNLTCKTPLDSTTDLKTLFLASSAPYKLWIKDLFTVFSPESFVRTEGDRISTFPMKGTRVKENDQSREFLLSDSKEAAEHATITDLLRNDLGRVCEKVEVKRYRYTEEIRTPVKTLLQVSSEISGILLPEFINRPGSLLEKILPAGSVTGAPKTKTVEIIKNVENFERGWFTGIMGICDGKKMDTGVMIRFVEKENGKLFFKSGGGITFLSNARDEYDEMIQKIYVPLP